MGYGVFSLLCSYPGILVRCWATILYIHRAWGLSIMAMYRCFMLLGLNFKFFRAVTSKIAEDPRKLRTPSTTP